MARRSLTAALALVSALGVLLDAQAPARPAWTQLRTADGQPDLQGIWTNATITPLERPASLKDKAFLTEAEAKALEKRTAELREEADKPVPGRFESYNQFWLDSGTTVLPTRQTSLVVDPPDGRVPVKPAEEQRRDETFANYGDAPESMSPWDRCITRGVPGGMLPAGYNNAYQILQFPGYVVIHYEMIHNARIIPIDGRPAVSPQLESWDGQPRGRWEGDQLIVETTHFNNKGWIATSMAGGRIKGIRHTDRLHIVERFQRTAADTISYSATIEDPEIYTRPWTVSFPLSLDRDYRIFEYACHEANYAMEGIMRGKRAQDARKQ
ncbi:MAG TPA: hypothetical protein VF491_20165 [Vicinamibacterales bacterium]|jgi:hypothetical protein